jgi:HK97 family phage major capsid protein
MDEKELKAFLAAQIEEVKKSIGQYTTREDMLKEYTSLEAKIKAGSIKGLEDKLTALYKSVDEQGLIMKKIGNREPVQPETIKQQLEKQIEKIKLLGHWQEPTEKTVILPGAITNGFGGLVVPGVGQMPFRKPRINALFANGNISPNNQLTIRYLEQTTMTQNAASRSVGGAPTESVYAWTGRNLPIEQITAIIPVALEMLENFDFIESEIRNSLMKELELRFEAEVALGTGVTPHLNSLDSRATTFVPATNFAQLFKGATVLDLIQAMAAQISHNSAWSANYCVMNDFDALALRLLKDDFGRFLFPNFLSPNGMNFGNITIIPSELCVANTLYVGDFSAGTLYKDNPIVTMGLDQADFSHRRVSLLANLQAALLIKNVDQAAFLKSTNITNDIVSIKAGA